MRQTELDTDLYYDEIKNLDYNEISNLIIGISNGLNKQFNENEYLKLFFILKYLKEKFSNETQKFLEEIDDLSEDISGIRIENIIPRLAQCVNVINGFKQRYKVEITQLETRQKSKKVI